MVAVPRMTTVPRVIALPRMTTVPRVIAVLRVGIVFGVLRVARVLRVMRVPRGGGAGSVLMHPGAVRPVIHDVVSFCFHTGSLYPPGVLSKGSWISD
ncbi:hypothetical protein GCM10022275_19270 [Tessaracoccus defluvii]